MTPAQAAVVLSDETHDVDGTRHTTVRGHNGNRTKLHFRLSSSVRYIR